MNKSFECARIPVVGMTLYQLSPRLSYFNESSAVFMYYLMMILANRTIDYEYWPTTVNIGSGEPIAGILQPLGVHYIKANGKVFTIEWGKKKIGTRIFECTYFVRGLDARYSAISSQFVKYIGMKWCWSTSRPCLEAFAVTYSIIFLRRRWTEIR